MKKVFAAIAITSFMAACSNSASEKEAAIQQAKQYTIDSMKAVAAEKEAEAKIAAEQRRAAAARNSSSSRTTVYRSYSEPGSSGSRDAHDRPGWSNKAKGAVIGGVVGAATGAAVSEKKGKGAIIGGVVGAAGGYGVGAILDNKKKKNQ
ncbi:MAG TPA: YMGG-like glycine zipper-containing protein [Chitinophagaceae bacterium]